MKNGKFVTLNYVIQFNVVSKQNQLFSSNKISAQQSSNRRAQILRRSRPKQAQI